MSFLMANPFAWPDALVCFEDGVTSAPKHQGGFRLLCWPSGCYLYLFIHRESQRNGTHLPLDKGREALGVQGLGLNTDLLF